MDFYINSYKFYTPGLISSDDWKAYFAGEKFIGEDTESPNIEFVPPMLRRKLSQSIKITLFVAHYASLGQANFKSVYTSRFGEWEKTVKQLQMYFEEKELSPAVFGLSVHNAPIGMFSLLNGNTKPYTSISGCEHSFDVGLIEAVSTLQTEDKVLFVSADERIPDFYKSAFPEKLNPLAIGLMLSNKRLSKQDIHLQICIGDQYPLTKNNYQQSLKFIKFLLEEKEQFVGKNYQIKWIND